MSKSVEQRIVEMRFDNKQFESGVQESLGTVDRLKKRLNFEESEKSLSNLEKAGKNFSLSSISDSVDTIAKKFTNLGIIGVTALQNITNRAIDAGIQFAKSLTLEPIMSGFSEYETKMNAITTILTNTKSKGTTLDDVNAALSELNAYADQTIYNFGEMTRNIGTFTAAGVDLDTSVKAIKGIANLAAGSGSTSAQASSAMYQLSQALAAGRVSLQDWNSVVNAGMGGELFQNALKETAREMGVFVDESVSFRESINAAGGGESWLTSDILIKTLEKFAENEDLVKAATQVKTITQLVDTMKESVQSGWAQSWEYIIGNKDEATETLTAVSDAFNNIIGPSTDARNSMLEFWHDNGGRAAVIEAITNAFNGLAGILRPIRDAFREVFPAITGEQLVDISERIRELTSNFKISEKTANNIKRTFKGLFAIVDIGVQLFSALASGVSTLVGYLLPAGDGLLSFTGSIGDYIVKLDEAIKSTDFFQQVIEKITGIFGPIIDGIKSFVSSISETIKGIANVDIGPVEDFSNSIQERLHPIAAISEFIGSVFDKMASVMQKIAPVFYSVAGIIGKAFEKVREAIGTAISSFSFDQVFDLVNGGLFAAILVGFKNFINSLTDITDNVGGFLGNITGILDGVKGSLEAFQSSLKADVLSKIATAIAILTGSLVVLSLIDSEKLTYAMTTVTSLLVELFAAMGAFEKLVDFSGVKGIGRAVIMMIGLSTAVLILTGAIANLARLDVAGLAKGLVGVGGAMAILVIASSKISSYSGSLIRTSIGLVIFAKAISVLSESVESLGSLSVKTLGKGLIAVGVLCAELVAFMKLTDLDGMGLRSGAGLLLLAEAVSLLTNSVSQFSKMDTEAMIQGLVAVGAILGELSLFVNLTANSAKVIGTATGLVIIASSMLIFENVVSKFGSMPFNQIAKGLIGMAGSLTAVTMALKGMPEGSTVKAISIIGVSSALIILSNAVSSFSSLSVEELAKGLISLGISLGIVVAAMKLMNSSLTGAASIVIISTALLMFVPILKSLGSMKITEIGTALIALAGAFTILGIAGAVLAPFTTSIIALTGSITLLGIGIAAVGAGVLMFSVAMASLAVSGTAGATALVAVFSAVIGLIPELFKQIGNGIVEFSGIITRGAPAIAEAFVALILAAVDAITQTAPAIVSGIFALLQNILDTLVQYTPTITDALFKIIIGFLDTVAANMPQLIKTGANLVASFLTGVIDVLSDFSPENLATGIAAITALMAVFEILAKMSGQVKQALKTTIAMVGVIAAFSIMFLAIGVLPVEKTIAIAGGLSALMLSLSGAIAIMSAIPIPGTLSAVAGLGIAIGGITTIIAALGAINQIPGFSWLMEEGTKVIGQIGNAIGSFVGNIIGGFLGGVSSSFPKIGSDLADFMTNAKPFFDGLDGINTSSLDSVSRLANMVLVLTASDVLNGLTSWFTGGSSLTKFGQDLAQFGPYLKQYCEAVNGVTPESVSASANAAKTLAEFAANIPDSGGVVDFFTGSNDMTEFGDKLVEFAPKLKEYAGLINGLEPAVVTNSANAAKALAEFAANVPDSGGLVEFFAGGNDISTFGDNLISFAPKFKEYANSMNGLEPAVVTNSANAAKALTELASNIPDTGGLVAFFAGDNNIEGFGNNLANFGNAFKRYYDSISEIKFDEFSASITEINNLVNLAQRMNDTDPTGMAYWAASLGDIGATGVDAFLNAFRDAGETADAIGGELSNKVMTAMSAYIGGHTYSLEQSADLVVTTFTNRISNTIQNQTITATSSVKNMFDGMIDTGLNTVSDSISRFETSGNHLMTGFQNGLDTGKNSVSTTVSSMMSGIVISLNAYYDGFYNAGSHVVTGFSSGIKDNKSLAINAAIEVAREALQAAKDELDINSPSKEFALLGLYSDEGFAFGLRSNLSRVKNAAEYVGNSSLETFRETVKNISSLVNGEIDTSPTIRPVIDLTNAKSGAQSLNRLLSNQNATVSIGGYSSRLAQTISGTRSSPVAQFDSKIPDNTKVVAAINDLAARVDRLNEAVTNMKVVMDTGTVVGQLESTIDRRLGVMALRKERGI